MRELEKIVTEVALAKSAGQSIALATVVGIAGSGYRLPGARMLIVGGKWIAGSISGGCLEEDVVLRSAEAGKAEVPLIVTSDTTGDDDIVFGVGLGCKGVITVLVEPIDSTDNATGFIDFAKECMVQGLTGTVATVVAIQGSVGCAVGARCMTHEKAIFDNITDPELAAEVHGSIGNLNPSLQSDLVRISLRSGSADVFFERIEPPTPLVIFGAGHDAMPLVRLAKELGWHVTIVDHRPSYATSERFPLADRVVLSTPERLSLHDVIKNDTLAVIMTHNYLRDLKLLERLISMQLRYVGLLGPKRRSADLLAEVGRSGCKPGLDLLQRIYSPVGLDIGSENPAEVALSIVAEMQAVLHSRAGGFLRDRKKSIHDRTRENEVAAL